MQFFDEKLVPKTFWGAKGPPKGTLGPPKAARRVTGGPPGDPWGALGVTNEALFSIFLASGPQGEPKGCPEPPQVPILNDFGSPRSPPKYQLLTILDQFRLEFVMTSDTVLVDQGVPKPQR